MDTAMEGEIRALIRMRKRTQRSTCGLTQQRHLGSYNVQSAAEAAGEYSKGDGDYRAEA